VPQLTDPGRHAYLTEIAAMMDDRKQRIGQHTAQHPPPWAVKALGPVPAYPAARQEWQNKAASIGAYRETYGCDHPGDPIGPEPTRDAPDQRAAWHEAFLALGPVDGSDVRATPDGRLWLIRDTYAAETAWAPRHVGKELRLARLGAAGAELRRRHPDQQVEPLRSSEPAVVSDTDRAELTLAPDKKIGEMGAWIRELAAERQSFREKLDELQGLKVPSEDPDWDDLGEAFPSWNPPGRDAILQPPKPQITPSAKILQLAAERDTEPEAAD
jgi:hypothetical protein